MEVFLTLLLFSVVTCMVTCQWEVEISTRWMSVSLVLEDKGKALGDGLLISRDAYPVTLFRVIINEPFVPFLSSVEVI